MLPDLRIVVGAVVITALLGMAGVGLFAGVRLMHHAKMGPLEAARNAAFTDNSEWNQFYEPGSVRRFVGLARKAEAIEAAQAAAKDRAEIVASPSAAIALQPAEMPQSPIGMEAAPSSAAVSTPEEQAVEIAPASSTVPTTPAAPDRPHEIAAAQTSDVPMAAVPAVTARESHSTEAPMAAEPLLHAPDQPVIANNSATAGRTAAPSDTTPMDAHESNGDQAPSHTTSENAGAENDPPAAVDRIATAPSTVFKPSAPGSGQSPPPSEVPTRSPPPARASATVPPPRHAPPAVKHAAQGPEAAPERHRAASAPRARAGVSRQRYAAPQPYGPQWNGSQWTDPQPPHQSRAAPQLTGQPQFGPYFPYGSQPPTAAQRRAQQYRAQQHGAPAYDPRQFAPPQPSYNNPYGWR